MDKNVFHVNLIREHKKETVLVSQTSVILNQKSLVYMEDAKNVLKEWNQMVKREYV